MCLPKVHVYLGQNKTMVHGPVHWTSGYLSLEGQILWSHLRGAMTESHTRHPMHRTALAVCS